MEPANLTSLANTPESEPAMIAAATSRYSKLRGAASTCTMTAPAGISATSASAAAVAAMRAASAGTAARRGVSDQPVPDPSTPRNVFSGISCAQVRMPPCNTPWWEVRAPTDRIDVCRTTSLPLPPELGSAQCMRDTNEALAPAVALRSMKPSPCPCPTERWVESTEASARCGRSSGAASAQQGHDTGTLVHYDSFLCSTPLCICSFVQLHSLTASNDVLSGDILRLWGNTGTRWENRQVELMR